MEKDKIFETLCSVGVLNDEQSPESNLEPFFCFVNWMLETFPLD
jgi:hypothetical protein